jgi:hypothetical protein
VFAACGAGGNGLRRPAAHPLENLVDLGEVWPALRPLLEPHEIPGIDPCDLGDGPADVAAERQDAA